MVKKYHCEHILLIIAITTGYISLQVDAFDFFKDNNFNFVNIISDSTGKLDCKLNKLMKTYFVRMFNISSVQRYDILKSDFNVLCLPELSSLSSNIFQWVSKIPVLKGLIIIGQDVQQSELEMFMDLKISPMPISFHFFILCGFKQPLIWKRVIKIEDQPQVAT